MLRQVLHGLRMRILWPLLNKVHSFFTRYALHKERPRIKTDNLPRLTVHHLHQSACGFGVSHFLFTLLDEMRDAGKRSSIRKQGRGEWIGRIAGEAEGVKRREG